jgi:hypothetical protein
MEQEAPMSARVRISLDGRPASETAEANAKHEAITVAIEDAFRDDVHMGHVAVDLLYSSQTDSFWIAKALDHVPGVGAVPPGGSRPEPRIEDRSAAVREVILAAGGKVDDRR